MDIHGAVNASSTDHVSLVLQSLSMRGTNQQQQQQQQQQQKMLLPSGIDLYRMGIILSNNNHDDTMLETVFQTYMNAIPFSYLCLVLQTEFQPALERTIVEHEQQQQQPCKHNNSNKSNNDGTKTTTTTTMMMEAYQSLTGLLLHSSTACRAMYSIQLCTTMTKCYKHSLMLQQQQSSSLLQEAFKALWYHGLIPKLQNNMLHITRNDNNNNDNNDDDDHHYHHVMTLIQEMTADDQNTFLGDSMTNDMKQILQQTLCHTTTNSTIAGTPSTTTMMKEQCDYILEMLSSSTKSTDFIVRTSTTSSNESSYNNNNNKTGVSHTTTTTTTTTPQSEIQRRIQQVKEVLPSLDDEGKVIYGDGYIETALACFQGNVSQTISVLLDDYNEKGNNNKNKTSSSLPLVLQTMDRTMGARKHSMVPLNTKNYSAAVGDDDEEMRRLNKIRLQDMERQAETEEYIMTTMMRINNNNNDNNNNTTTTTDTTISDSQFMANEKGYLNEYDDDYDDQYDEQGMGNINDGGGMYDYDMNVDGGGGNENKNNKNNKNPIKKNQNQNTESMETIRMYNRLARDAEQEDSFWQENRNTNHFTRTVMNNNKKKNNKNDDDNDDDDDDDDVTTQKYRSPNKIRGGRILGPDGKVIPRRNNNNKNNNAATGGGGDTTAAAAGGGGDAAAGGRKKAPAAAAAAGSSAGGSSSTTTTKDGTKNPTELSKLQKRRKNDNKAKIANHHRKDRAQRKTGGM